MAGVGDETSVLVRQLTGTVHVWKGETVRATRGRTLLVPSFAR